MKIRIVCKEEHYDDISRQLTEGDIILSKDEADCILIENGAILDSVIGKNKEDFLIIKPQDIFYVESYGNDVYAVTSTDQYLLREKLYEIEYLLFQKGFIRVSKSYVINVNHIKSIRPTFNMKYVLKMKNDTSIDVTRSYYYRFKEFVGL